MRSGYVKENASSCYYWLAKVNRFFITIDSDSQTVHSSIHHGLGQR